MTETINSYNKLYSYFYEEIKCLYIGKEIVTEFDEGIGVYLDESGIYSAYFLSDGNVSCNGLCLRINCMLEDIPSTFLFDNPSDCAKFIVLNMLNRTNVITYILDPDKK